MSFGDRKAQVEILDEEIAWGESRLTTLSAQAATFDPAAGDWLDELSESTERSVVEERLHEQRALRSRLLEGVLRLRLRGRPVVGTAVESDVLERVVRNIRRTAASVGASPLVGVPTEGSHVVEFVSEDQRQLGDPFDQMALAVVDAFAAAHASDVDRAVTEFAERNDAATVQSVSTLLNGLAKDGLDVDAISETGGSSRRVSLDRRQANDLARAFADAERELQIEVVTGVLLGALEKAGRFEIQVGEQVVTGSIRADLRSDLNGLMIGQVVRATIQRSRTTYPSGRPAKERVSLQAIESAAS